MERNGYTAEFAFLFPVGYAPETERIWGRLVSIPSPRKEGRGGPACGLSPASGCLGGRESYGALICAWLRRWRGSASVVGGAIVTCMPSAARIRKWSSLTKKA